jgi:hypothetical protein
MVRSATKFVALMVVALGSCLALNAALAQGEKSLASTLNVYVFPSGGQSSSQQSKDEGTCYSWAVKNTGTDPFELSKKAAAQAQQQQQAQQQASQAGQGAAAGGAVGGAAVGALIGGVFRRRPGRGAAIGATIGAIGGQQKARAAEAGAQMSAEQAAAATEAENKQQMGNFKKAFAACLEGKKYTVEY